MFGQTMNWKTWKDILKWVEKKGYKKLAERMRLNNACWMSSGEFGKSQVEICDSLRYAQDEDEALEIASELNEAMSENFGLY